MMGGVGQTSGGGASVAELPEPAIAAAPDAASGSQSRRIRLFGALAFAITALLSIAIPFQKLHLAKADLAVPLAYGHDSFPILCWVKNLTVTGWWMSSDRCGAPYGQEMYDFPTNPTIHFAIIRAMLPLSHDPAILVNAYYLLSFPLIGLAAHAALRAMRITHLYSILGGVLYACQHFHLWCGENHLFLSTYFLLPLVTMVMVWIHRGEALLIRRDGDGRLKWNLRNRRSIAAVLIVAAEGCDFPYFSLFAGFFLLIAGLTSFALHRDRAVLARAAILLAILVASFSVSLSPNLLYFYREGTNPSPTHMSHHPWADGEEYALKPIQLLLPPPKHPLPALERIRARYYAGTKLPSGSDAMAMGALASLGFLAMLVCVPLCSRSRTERGRLFHLLGVLLVAGIVFCTAGGIGTMFNLLSLTLIRCYFRACIFLAFFSLAGFCGLLDGVYRRYFGDSRIGFGLGVLAIAGLIFLGTNDQMGETHLEPFETVRAEYESDRDFVFRVEDSMPPGAMIYQYPYIAFGSYTNAQGGMLPYSHFRGYIHSRTSKWSFGGMYGRSGENQHAKIAEMSELEDQFRAIAILGFDGIYIDRVGYADRGRDFEAKVRRLTEAEPIVSRDDRLAFYPLAAYRKKLLGDLTEAEVAQLRKEFESFPTATWADQFYAEERSEIEGWRRWHWCGSHGTLVLTNPSAISQTVRVRMILRAVGPTAKMICNGESIDFLSGNVTLERVLVLEPGANRFEFHCDGPTLPVSDRAFPLAFALHDFTMEPAVKSRLSK